MPQQAARPPVGLCQDNKPWSTLKVFPISKAQEEKWAVHYSQQPSYGNSQDAPLLTTGSRKCGIYTQWNFMQP
jgi:hypothetical protein